MLGTDIKTAFRNLKRNKIQSSISILGLGIGLGCIILLSGLFIHEKSFDKFIPDHQNVYRILMGETSNTQYPLLEEMKGEYPEVKTYFRFYQTNEIELRNKSNELVEDNYFGFADTSIYSILGIRLIAGVPAVSSLEVAISRETAMKYFGNTAPLGEILSVKLNNKFLDLSISAVYENFPSTSTLFPEFIANIKLSEMMFRQFQASLGEYGSENQTALNWENSSFLSYLVLDKNSNKDALVRKMAKYKEHITNERFKDYKYSLQPVTDIYLHSGDHGSLFSRAGNPNELKYYQAISFIILLISITNYILLTRAGTTDRLRELGTRKALGASRNNIFKQIILESNLITLLSLIPAFFVINFGMTFINNTLNKSLSFDIFSNPLMWLLLLTVVLITGSLSGIIIGYKISGIKSLLLLSGKVSEFSKSRRWNYSFLTIHFSIYIILVVSVLTVSKQIRYSLTNFKGINPDNIIVCNLNAEELKSSFNAFCDEMEKIPGVIMTSGSSFIPPFNSFLPVNLANNTNGEKVRFDGLIMGEGMTELLGIEVVDGESFGPFNPDRRDVLFNESSALKYELKAGDNYLGFNIRGIVKDFHAHSLHSLIQPMVILQQNPSRMGLLAIKTDGNNDEAIIKRLKELYTEIAPNEIFEIRYLTDDIRNFYSRERYQGKIIGAFSLLAMVLSVMGLFGIAMISISRKRKEIGIRKVNGASIAGVLYMLNIDFVKWVILSAIISVPASFYLISSWQDRFAYKTELSWWIFTLAVISAIFVSLITVSWQSWRAATKNPVEALRYE